MEVHCHPGLPMLVLGGRWWVFLGLGPPSIPAEAKITCIGHKFQRLSSCLEMERIEPVFLFARSELVEVFRPCNPKCHEQNITLYAFPNKHLISTKRANKQFGFGKRTGCCVVTPNTFRFLSAS